MPNVGNKHYSYDPKGIAMAKNASKKTGKPVSYGKGGTVEKKGVLYESMPKSKTPSTNMGHTGFSRGGGAAISGTIFRGVK